MQKLDPKFHIIVCCAQKYISYIKLITLAKYFKANIYVWYVKINTQGKPRYLNRYTIGTFMTLLSFKLTYFSISNAIGGQ